MSELMNPISFEKLLNHVLEEYKTYGTIYNVTKIHKNSGEKNIKIFGENLESPLGIAAGPHTQMAQNIIAGYAAGARFMALKTVQEMYGEDLGIKKPCIRAEDEGYNVEWSSEFPANIAAEEYIKAYLIIKVISKEFALGSPDGFIMNISVGYNLEGLKSPLTDGFIDTMKDAKDNKIYRDAIKYLEENLFKFKNFTREDLEKISPRISNSMTLSTMHGCPPKEVEKMVEYLLEEKKINTYVKLNPTLLGYERVREILDENGYDYIEFGREQFDHDMKYEDLIPMLNRLKKVAEKENLEFGAKISNTFQCKINSEELPGTDQYMSGPALYPLSINVAAKIAKDTDGKIPMSYSGGADKNNIREIFDTGIHPVTVCTPLLKPNGYDVLENYAKLLEDLPFEIEKIDEEKLELLAEKSTEDKNYKKPEQKRKKYDLKKSYKWARSDSYICKVLCKNCIKVCPNRTNEELVLEDKKIIIHNDSICNECGACQFYCVEPCTPYLDRVTYFEKKEDIKKSENDGFAIEGDMIYYRWKKEEGSSKLELLDEELKTIVEAYREKKNYCI